MGSDLKRATDLIKAGENAQARDCLIDILKADPTNDTAWVWMAAVVETQLRKRECLEEALKYNPRNKIARRALQGMATPPASSIIGSKGTVARAKKLSATAHILCGWPLVLVIFGGAIGGGLGGLAYVVNIAIYKASMPAIFKIVLNLSVGFAAIGIWYAIATAIIR
jgi:hypothetical protein